MGFKSAEKLVFTGLAGTTNCVAGTTYYFFTRGYTGFRVAFNNCYCVIPCDGTITAASIMTSGGATTAEAWTWNICKNDSTDYPISTIANIDAIKDFTNFNMNVPVKKLDQISFKCTCPNPWVTPAVVTGCLGYFVLSI